MTELRTTASTKKRYAYLDLFRLVAAISVVVIHLTASAIMRYEVGSLPQLMVTAVNGIALFAVPAFIFISAYTFMFIYGGKSFDFPLFLRKRLSVLLIPYLSWTLVYYLDQLHFSGGTFSLIEYLGHLWLGNAFYHLYFMPIIFQFYLLFAGLKWLIEKYNPTVVLGLTFLLYVVYVQGLPFANHFEWIKNLNDWLPLKSDFKYSDRIFPSYMPFYMFGIYLGHLAKQNKLPWKVLCLISLPVYFLSEISHTGGRIAYYVYQSSFDFQIPFAWEISSLSFIALLLALCLWIENAGVKLSGVVLLSGFTFNLYLAHPLILQLCEIKLVPLFTGSYTISLLITFILAFCLPLLASLAVHLLKKSIKTTS